jgi:hypothetical protein
MKLCSVHVIYGPETRLQIEAKTCIHWVMEQLAHALKKCWFYVKEPYLVTNQCHTRQPLRGNIEGHQIRI